MSESLARKLFPNSSIYVTDLTLVSYCRQAIKLLGYIIVNVRCGDRLHKLNLYITKEKRSTLLGREWIAQLRQGSKIKNFLDEVESIKIVETTSSNKLKALLHKYREITILSISKIQNVQSKLTLKENAKPVFCKARPVPFRLRSLVENELFRLESEGVLEKVNTAEWATPIVPVLKKNVQIRICGDFSVTLNPQLIVDDHPLPTPDELFATMAGGVIFSR